MDASASEARIPTRGPETYLLDDARQPVPTRHSELYAPWVPNFVLIPEELAHDGGQVTVAVA